MNFHFGIVVVSENFVFASVDCARTYPIFWKQNGKKILISSKAKNIVEKNDKIDSKQLIAYQMSGYTIDEKTLWKGIHNINPGTFIFMDEMKQINSVKYFSYEPWVIKKRNSKSIEKN